LRVRRVLRLGRKGGPSGPLPGRGSDEKLRVLAGGASDDRGIFLREVNDIIGQTAERLETGGTSWRFLCECGRRGCRETVELTLDEYDSVTARGFLVARGHRKSAA
jgi:hypothetical protein